MYERTSMKEQIELIEAYDDFVQSKIDAGWLAYLTTSMFCPLAGKLASKVTQMKAEVKEYILPF